ALQPLRRVLARRPAAEIPVDDKNRGAAVARVVERMRRVGRAVVLEDVPLEAFERHRLQEARRHDAVGVDVVAAQRQRAPGHARAGGRRLMARCWIHASTASGSTVRTSTTSPAIAAAATIAGLISSV